MSGSAAIARTEPLSPNTSRAPTVVLDGLGKRFPERRRWAEMIRHPRRTTWVKVVQGVSVSIGEGEFFGLLGPNGAGKTTLFKMLATLIIPDEGTATIAGYDVVQDAAAVRRVLAPVIADERSLYWRLTATANLELYGALQGLDGAESRRRAEELLRVVGLEDAREKIVGSFSSGMKQRLLIARALIARPRVLLLDEPTRSLDPISARAFRTFLREEISGRQRCTVLLATHNAEEALELCDRVAVLDRGRLLAAGTAERLSREIGDERYRLFTKDPAHPGIAALGERGVAVGIVERGVDEDGWTRVEMEIPGGAERAAQVVAFLVEQGVSVSRFERVNLSLADLIERIVQRGRREAGDA
ncbi:MAG TPA: ABC transporter ATP-binding protein [Gemmatimonadaceae bacterium]|nr:ABC transporter ATP-binding protein [Gemmatimonadaceae bacterium]